MTKLVLVLAVVVVVILVVVIVAVRNMRTEDPDEFADQRDGGRRTRGGEDDRDMGYRRRESAGRQQARTGRNAPSAGGPAPGRSAAARQGNVSRSAAPGRGYDDRREQPAGRGSRRAPAAGDSRGYDAEQGFDQRDGRPYDDRRSGPAASGPQKRRRPENGTQHQPDAPAPARSRRRSGDSSEWDSSEWDQLSDVDYWAELASQKPMTSGPEPTQPAPSRPAAHRGSGAAAPAQDAEPETMAVRSPVPGGAPRRDPVTGLPVRGPQASDAELTVAGGRTDFAPAPVPSDQLQDRRRSAAASNGDRSSRHHRRPAASQNGASQNSASQNSASQNGNRAQTGRPLPAPPASDRGQRFLDASGRDPGRYLDVGPASLPMPAIRDVPSTRRPRPRDLPPAPPAAAPPAAQAPPVRRQRPVPLDDDPLTSPSFPAVQAADSRSYRNRRSDTPPGGSLAPAPYPAAAPQRPGYDAPTAQYPGAQYSAPQYPAAPYPEAQYPTAQYPTAPAPQAPGSQRSGQHSAPQYPVGDGRSNSGAYHTDPLPSRNPYPGTAANGSAAAPAAQPAHGPVTPASGNPYGSYVTPDSQQTPASGYNGYGATPVNGNGLPYQAPPAPGTGQNGNGYWHQPDQARPQQPDYRNGYGQDSQAGYPANGYPAGPDNPAGYAPDDPYGSDGYGGYPEYGAAER
jgi:hypothetical protein